MIILIRDEEILSSVRPLKSKKAYKKAYQYTEFKIYIGKDAKPDEHDFIQYSDHLKNTRELASSSIRSHSFIYYILTQKSQWTCAHALREERGGTKYSFGWAHAQLCQVFDVCGDGSGGTSLAASQPFFGTMQDG